MASEKTINLFVNRCGDIAYYVKKRFTYAIYEPQKMEINGFVIARKSVVNL